MNITHKYDAPTGDVTSVEVTFTCDAPEFDFVRSVNAAFDEDGSYNAGLTEERVVAVGLGVKNKIEVGVIKPPVEE